MRIDDLRSQERVGGFEANVHQAAVGHALDAQTGKKRSELRRGFQVRQAAGAQGVGSRSVACEISLPGENATADGLQGHGFAGENLGLRLNVVVKIADVVIRVRTLEWKDVGIFPVNFDTRGGDVNGFHAESADGGDGDNGKHEREDEPLVLAKDEEVIIKMRLMRRKIPRRQARRKGNNLYSAMGAVFVRDDFVVLNHTLGNEPVNNDAGADGQTELTGADESLLEAAFRDIQDVTRLKADIFGFELHDSLEIDLDLALLAAGILAHDDSAVGLGVAIETAGQGEKLESSELAAIVGDRKAAGSVDGAEGIHDAGVRYGNDIAGQQDNIAGGVASLKNLIEVYGDGVGDRGRDSVTGRTARCSGSRPGWRRSSGDTRGLTG